MLLQRIDPVLSQTVMYEVAVGGMDEKFWPAVRRFTSLEQVENEN